MASQVTVQTFVVTRPTVPSEEWNAVPRKGLVASGTVLIKP